MLGTSLNRDSTNLKVPAKRKRCSVACRSVRISRSSHSSKLWDPPKCYQLAGTVRTTLRKRSVAAQVILLLSGDTSCKPNLPITALRWADVLRANPDLVDRLKTNQPLYKWDRGTFYGPFADNELGYTVRPSREMARADDHLQGQLA